VSNNRDPEYARYNSQSSTGQVFWKPISNYNIYKEVPVGINPNEHQPINSLLEPYKYK
jgi:hypothetical protein